MSMPAGGKQRSVDSVWRARFGEPHPTFTLLDFQSEGGRIISITSDPIQDRMGR